MNWEEYFKNKGYDKKTVFHGEYMLLENTIMFRKVRIYENGMISEYNHYTGGYRDSVPSENFKPLK